MEAIRVDAETPRRTVADRGQLAGRCAHHRSHLTPRLSRPLGALASWRLPWCLVPLVFSLTAVLPREASAQVFRDLRGTVRSITDSTPLPNVRVTVVGRRIPAVSAPSAYSGADGSFTLPRIPLTGVGLALTRASLAPDTVPVPDSVTTVTVYALVLAVALPEVVISAFERPIARERFETEAQPSTVSLAAADIQRAPAILEADVVRVVQYLPGSVAKNDYSIGYNVRGGESDQNLIQLDGIPIFNPSHLAGLFSTFDANAVASTDFYSGGFPADYSGRLSSVLDIGIRPGNPERIGVSGQVSLLSSKVLVEGPVGGRATWLASVRRTYADALVGLFSSEVLPYYFTDALGKVTLPYGRRGSLAVTGYWGRDVLDLELVKATPTRESQRLAFDWGNALVGATWQQPLGAKAMLTTRAGLSTFSTVLGLRPSLADFTNDVALVTAQTVLQPAPGARHDVHVGAAVETYDMNYGVRSLALETDLFQAHYAPTVWSAFAEDTWRAARWLLLRPGARVDYVTGADATAFSPRLSFRAFVTPTDAIQGSVGRYHQAIHSIRDQEIPVTIFEFWIGADQYVPVARADHLVLGYERWFGGDVQLTIEGYRKTFANLVTPNRGQDLRVTGDEYIPAEGDAWGGDILLRKHAGAIRGWIAYGYTRATRRAQGVEFPPAHDRRHTLNLIAFAPGPLGSDMGVRFGVGSPLPYTGFIGEWDHRLYDATTHRFSDAETEPISTTINGQRYPTYTRLDVSFRWQFEKWGGQWEPFVQLANVYNRKNPFVYVFDYDVSPATRTGVSQIPLLPTFGVEFWF